MQVRDLVAVGASAGGLDALMKLAALLPRGLSTSILVVVHGSANGPGHLACILDRAGALSARMAVDGERIAHERIYVAPPDRHLVVDDSRIRVTSGPRENGFRPAIDPLFRTAADAYGARVVAVLLSGGLDDGVEGAAAVRTRGGLTVAQDLREACVPALPEAAIRAGCIDRVLTVAGIASLIRRVATKPAAVDLRAPAPSRTDDIALRGSDLHDGHPVERFRCHLGHAFTAEGLLEKQGGQVERALWVATRALEERAELARRMGARASEMGLAGVATGYGKRASEAEREADLLRRSLNPGRKPAQTGVDRGGRAIASAASRRRS
jgi:two-component system, chemotaxis family, protein-glutamate methylesterase/glutaminase